MRTWALCTPRFECHWREEHIFLSETLAIFLLSSKWIGWLNSYQTLCPLESITFSNQVESGRGEAKNESFCPRCELSHSAIIGGMLFLITSRTHEKANNTSRLTGSPPPRRVFVCVSSVGATVTQFADKIYAIVQSEHTLKWWMRHIIAEHRSYPQPIPRVRLRCIHVNTYMGISRDAFSLPLRLFGYVRRMQSATADDWRLIIFSIVGLRERSRQGYSRSTTTRTNE